MQRPFTANFGAGRSALTTVGFEMTDAAGNIQIARTTAGVTEMRPGSGVYKVVVNIPDAMLATGGTILWDSGQSPSNTLFVEEDIFPMSGLSAGTVPFHLQTLDEDDRLPVVSFSIWDAAVQNRIVSGTTDGFGTFSTGLPPGQSYLLVVTTPLRHDAIAPVAFDTNSLQPVNIELMIHQTVQPGPVGQSALCRVLANFANLQYQLPDDVPVKFTNNVSGSAEVEGETFLTFNEITGQTAAGKLVDPVNGQEGVLIVRSDKILPHVKPNDTSWTISCTAARWSITLIVDVDVINLAELFNVPPGLMQKAAGKRFRMTELRAMRRQRPEEEAAEDSV